MAYLKSFLHSKLYTVRSLILDRTASRSIACEMNVWDFEGEIQRSPKRDHDEVDAVAIFPA